MSEINDSEILGDIIKISKGKKADEVFDSPQANALRYLQIEDLRPEATLKYARTGKGVVAVPEDVIIAWDGANAGTASYGLDGYIGSTLAVLRPQKREIHTPFLGHFIQSKAAFLRERCSGATIPHVDKSVLENIAIPLPPLPEQQRIAATLERADHLCRTRRFARQMSDSFLQSVFLKMFGDPVSNPMGWNVVVLEEHLSKIESGWSPVCGETRSTDNEWAVLKLSAVTGGKYIPNENKQLLPETVTRPKLEVKKGDVLFTRKNTEALVAACAYVFQTPPRLLLPDTVFRFAFKNESEIAPIYLWAMLTNKDFKRRVQMLATGSAGSMPNISKEKLLELKIPLPPIEKQREFAAIVRRFERFRAGQIEAERQANHLFETLLHRAFSTE